MPVASDIPVWNAIGTNRWAEIDWTVGWNTSLPLDPYLVWADVSDLADLKGPGVILSPPLPPFFFRASIQVVIETKSSVQDFALRISGNPKIYDPLIELPVSYGSPAAGASGTHFCSAKVSTAFIRHFATQNPIVCDYVSKFQLALPVIPNMNVIGPRAIPRRLEVEKVATIVGVIDDGLPFANAAFLDRILSFWNQDDSRFKAPWGFGYGSEYGQALPFGAGSQIDRWISNSSANGTLPIDEEAMYQLAGTGASQLRRRVTHGSAVLGMAARDIESTGIICVQLPALTTKDTSGGALSPYALDALHYLLVVADKVGVKVGNKQLPVIANLSYGNMASSHDGTSIIERAIDELIEICHANRAGQFGVIIPSGNSRQARCHAAFDLNSSNSRLHVLAWRVHPDDATPSFLEVWLPVGHSGANVSIQVAPPNESFGPNVSIGGMYSLAQPGKGPICGVIFPHTPSDSTARKLVLVALAPTSSLGSNRSLASAGVWRVQISSATDVASIDAWIQRDDSPYGYPRRGRQSYFEDPNYVRFTRYGVSCESDHETDPPFEGDQTKAYVRRSGTLNGIATGKSTIVAGAYRGSDWKATSYTSSGPVQNANDHGNSLLAQVSDDSRVSRGVLTTGTHSGSSTTFSGTSIAAPQVTGEIADLLSQGKRFVRLSRTAQMPPPRIELAAINSNPPSPPNMFKGPLVVYAPIPTSDALLGLGRLDRSKANQQRTARRRIP